MRIWRRVKSRNQAVGNPLWRRCAGFTTRASAPGAPIADLFTLVSMIKVTEYLSLGANKYCRYFLFPQALALVGAQKIPFGKGQLYEENVNSHRNHAQGNLAKAQGTTAICCGCHGLYASTFLNFIFGRSCFDQSMIWPVQYEAVCSTSVYQQPVNNLGPISWLCLP